MNDTLKESLTIPGNLVKQLISKTPRYIYGFGKDILNKSMKKKLSEVNVNDEVKKRAKYAKNAYLDEMHRPYHLDEYKYIPQLSNPYHSVYADGNSKKILYNVRGTNDFRDIASDIFILNSNLKENERWKSEFKNIKSLVDDFSKKGWRFDITGHSLGARIVVNMMGDPEISEYVDRADAFNPGTMSNDTELAGLSDPGDKLQVHLARSDPVSEAYYYEDNSIGDVNNYDFNVDPLSAHFLSNFL